METLNNGIDLTVDCKWLVREVLPSMYPSDSFPHVKVDATPTIILWHPGIWTVSLWAWSLTSEHVYVNMSLPGVHRTLKELAESGAPWTDFQAIRYQFFATGPDPIIVDDSIIVDNSIMAGDSTIADNSLMVDDVSLLDINWLEEAPSMQM
ncbi:hypothetical protein ACHAPT_000991 [Fusarium lateritium]